MNEQKDFYTVNEFAEKIRVHPGTVFRGIKQGRIQAFRTGNGTKSSFRIPNTEIQRLCEMDMGKLIEKIVDEKLQEKSVKDV